MIFSFRNLIRVFFVDIVVDVLLVFLLFIHNYAGKKFGLLEYFGLLTGTASYVLWIVSRVQLGKYFSISPEAHGLVTHGIYSKIRNPIYVFGTLCLFGAVLPSKSLSQYFLLTCLIIFEIIRSSKEETVLTKRFGKKYSQYKSQTWF